MTAKPRIFVSSVQKGFTAGRRALWDFFDDFPAPEFREAHGQFVQTLWRPTVAAAEVTAQVTTEVTAQVDDEHKLLRQQSLEELAYALGSTAAQVTAQVEKTLHSAESKAVSREELQAAAGIRHREHFRKAYVEPLVKAGWLERTIPDKPTSRLQEYRLTKKGRTWLARRKP